MKKSPRSCKQISGKRNRNNRNYLFRNEDWIRETPANINTKGNTLGTIERKKMKKFKKTEVNERRDF